METFLIILAVIIAVFLIVFAVIAFVSKKFFGRGVEYDAEYALRNEPELLSKVVSGKQKISEYTPEEVSIKSDDGLTLYGLLYKSKSQTDTTVICFHGYHSNLKNDFCTVIGYFVSIGFNVLTVSQRCHGKSEGKCLTFGIKEKYDCLRWCEYVRSRFGENSKIILNGVSMGAATVTMASDKSVGLPENVKLIIADCGYSSPWEIICDVAKKNYHITKFPVIYLLRAVTKLIYGFDIKDGSSVEAVKNTDIPIFFAHGKADDFVPYYMGVKISNACVSKHELFSVENAGHGLAFMVDTDGYKKSLEEFIKENI